MFLEGSFYTLLEYFFKVPGGSKPLSWPAYNERVHLPTGITKRVVPLISKYSHRKIGRFFISVKSNDKNHRCQTKSFFFRSSKKRF